MIKSISNKNLEKGMVLALPFENKATIEDDPKVGYKYVTFYTERGKTRVALDGKTDIIIPDKKVPNTKIPNPPLEVHFKGMDPVVPVGGEIVPVRHAAPAAKTEKLVYTNRHRSLIFIIDELQKFASERNATAFGSGRFSGLVFGVLVQAGFMYYEDSAETKKLPEWMVAERTLVGLIENGTETEDVARLMEAMADSLAA